MSNVEDYQVSFSLEVNVEKAYEDLRKIQTILFRTLSLLRRFGLPEDIDAFITKLQRAIALLNLYRLTIISVEAASGPFGWALAGIGVATAVVDTAEFVMEIS